jgi:hypothetical protein
MCSMHCLMTNMSRCSLSNISAFGWKLVFGHCWIVDDKVDEGGL